MEILSGFKGPIACLLFLTVIAAGCRNTATEGQPPDRHRGQVDETTLVDQLGNMGDVAYDHPDRVVNNPDSFLNQLPSMPTSIEGKQTYAWLLLNIAYALRESGNILESTRYYELAMDYCLDHGLSDPDFVTYIAKPLGNLYTQIGDLQKSLSLHHRAITETKKGNDPTQLPSLYGNLAIVYQQLNWPDSLLAASRNGLNYCAEGDLRAALLHNTIARCYQESGKLDSAGHFNKLALEGFAARESLHGDTVLWYTAALHQYSHLASEQGAKKEALSAIDRAISIAETHFPTTKQREKAKYYFARGNIHSTLGENGTALQDFSRALSAFPTHHDSRHSYPDYTYTEALWGLARLHAAMGTDFAAYYYVKAIENAYYAQQLVVSTESHYQQSAWNRELLAQAMAQLWSAYEGRQDTERNEALARRMLWITELSKGRQLVQEINRSTGWGRDSTDNQLHRQQLRLLSQRITDETDSVERARLEQERDQLVFDFQLSENHFGKPFSPPDPIGFTDRLSHDSDSALLISYFVAPDSTVYCISMDSDHAEVSKLPPGKQATIAAFIDRYFGRSPAAYENDPESYRKNAGNLAAQLLPSRSMERKKRIIISPDGFLFALPFDALVKSGEFLAQSKTISYTYTFLQQVNDLDHPEDHTGKLAVFAKRNYRDKDLADLPYAHDEAGFISARFSNTETFVDDAATGPTFLHALSQGAVIHVAAHAIATGSEEPYVVLDEPVTLDKIKYIGTTSPLVFLSACQTAAGELLQGEGRESLNRAFLSKGVPGIIASNWTVDDRTTADLSRLFYGALSQNKMPAEALAQAKRAYLKSTGLVGTNPWYWASLQFTGTEVPVTLSTGYRSLVPYLIALMVILVLVVFFFIRRKQKGAATR